MSIENIIGQLIQSTKSTEEFSSDRCLQIVAIAQTHILKNQKEILERLKKIEDRVKGDKSN